MIFGFSRKRFTFELSWRLSKNFRTLHVCKFLRALHFHTSFADREVSVIYETES